jgi:2-haloacid dehalogenase
MSLDQVLDDQSLAGFDASDRDELTQSWERLPAWPDAAEGLSRLKQRYTLSTLSNGNRAQQVALVAFARLPLDRILSAEDFRHYKPDPEVYLGAASTLGLKPDQVLMVAAHKGDLRAAQAAGLRAAFVERPLEKGPRGGADLLPDPDADIQVAGFVELAARLGC